jgi:N6-L-threonylcarbamoyladenine synthase
MQQNIEFVLGIETSCDETSAAVISPRKVLSNVISSQAVHLKFGGVVPELASRAHLKKIIPIVQEALQQAQIDMKDINGIAVTNGPGLVGALLVGLNYVKGISTVLKIPFVGINHIEGHIFGNFLNNHTIPTPFICLVVSGGHTQIILVRDHPDYKVLGETRDDAVGEAFDKVAKLLELPYPGGPQIDRLAKKGNPDAISFPRALMKPGEYNFSYSGLKTAVLTYIQKIGPESVQKNMADICASFQKAAVEVLVKKTVSAARTSQIENIALAGGVGANSLLRHWIIEEGDANDMKIFIPQASFCTDNAAMIARAGLEHLGKGYRSDLTLNAFPSLRIDERHMSMP